MATPSTTSPGYVVVRLVPNSAVDGPTFSTYLDGLQLQLFEADTPAGQESIALSETVYCSPIVVYQAGQYGSSEPYLTTVSLPTSAPTPFASTNNYGNTLKFNSTDGIPIGASLFFPNLSDNLGFTPNNPTVIKVDETTVTLQSGTSSTSHFTTYVPAGTIASFLGQSPVSDPWSPSSTPFTFTLAASNLGTPLDPNAPTGSPPQVFTFQSVNGITVGMSVSGTDVQTGTTVEEVDSDNSTATLSLPLSAIPSSNPSLTFTLNPPYIAYAPTPDSSTTTSQLTVASVSGITVGMAVSATGYLPSGTTVTGVDPDSLTIFLSTALQKPLTPGVVISFGSGSSPIKLSALSSATTSQLTFITSPNGAQGIACGMTLAPVPTLVAPGTMVIEATQTTATVSPPLLANWPSHTPATFTFPLSSGIFQHVEVIVWDQIYGFFQSQWNYVVVPLSVATAVVSLNPGVPVNDYVNVSVQVTRNGVNLPIDQIFYNVKVIEDSAPPQSLQDYQGIATDQTGFYLSLPPLPGTTAVTLEIPSDGSPPPFQDLYNALTQAVQNDPFLGPTLPSSPSSQVIEALIATLGLDDCTRLAYEIVWSSQPALPDPPDPLEDLYTNPYYTGGGTTQPSPQGNNEPDRVKFEGTLNSFYSTNDATAERLTKFVAAVAGAIYCELQSLAATSALLEFPVDPSSSLATAVMSEVLLQGLGVTPAGTSLLHFGVPAPFFYVLGAQLEKSTSGNLRYQIATGGAIERILQEFADAELKNVITDSEPFTDPAFQTTKITSFQAARRLVALGVSAASTSPPVTLVAGSHLAGLVGDWLAATAPATLPPPNPQPTYQSQDFAIWTQLLASKDPAGYLHLDLAALTQGYVLPPVLAQPSQNPTSGTVLTFSGSTPLGVGVKMAVSGQGIASGTTVASVSSTTASGTTTTTVTLSVAASGVTTATQVTFNQPIPTVTLPTKADVSSTTTPPSTLTFASTSGLANNMLVSGPNIAFGTTVHSFTGTTVTLAPPAISGSTAPTVLGDIPSGTAIAFTMPVPPNIIPNTLADQLHHWLGSPTTPDPITGLMSKTATDWTTFFTTNPSWLPTYIQPASPAVTTTPPAAPSGGWFFRFKVRGLGFLTVLS